jgi:hypothetical protein
MNHYRANLDAVRKRAHSIFIEKQKSPRLAKGAQSDAVNDFYDVVNAHQKFHEPRAPEIKFGTAKKENLSVKTALKSVNVPAFYNYNV